MTNTQLKSKDIKRMVADGLCGALKEYGFVPKKNGVITLDSSANKTAFIIDVSIFVTRNHGSFLVEPAFYIYLPSFSAIFFDFFSSYIKENNLATKAKRNHVFLAREFFHIIPKGELKAFGDNYADTERELELLISNHTRAYRLFLDAWVRRWFEWGSAYDLVMQDENMCGAWRETAIFALTQEVFGRERACSWVGDPALDKKNSDISRAQIDYLRRVVCSHVAD